MRGRGTAWRLRRHGTGCRQRRQPARRCRARTPQGAMRPRSVVRKTRRVLTTLPDVVRQAARIRRILATSRESVTLSNDNEPRAARRRSRLGPCERAARRFHRLEFAARSAVPRPASKSRACRGLSEFLDPYLNTTSCAESRAKGVSYDPRPTVTGKRTTACRPRTTAPSPSSSRAAGRPRASVATTTPSATNTSTRSCWRTCSEPEVRTATAPPRGRCTRRGPRWISSR